MASNLTSQVRNIATVTTAVATGTSTKKITVDVKGEFLVTQGHHQLSMVDQLRSFASESDAASLVNGHGRGKADKESEASPDMKEPDRFGELQACNLSRPGARNIAASPPPSPTRSLSRKSRSTSRRNPRIEKLPSTRWWTSLSSFASK